MGSLRRVYSNLIYYTVYGVSWCLWQLGGKQIRRALTKSYDQIETADAARVKVSALGEEAKPHPLASKFDFTKPKLVNLTVDMWMDTDTAEWWFKFIEEPSKIYGPFPNDKVAELRASAEISMRQVRREDRA